MTRAAVGGEGGGKRRGQREWGRGLPDHCKGCLFLKEIEPLEGFKQRYNKVCLTKILFKGRGGSQEAFIGITAESDNVVPGTSSGGQEKRFDIMIQKDVTYMPVRSTDRLFVGCERN